MALLRMQRLRRQPIKELNGIGSGFIVIDFKIKHSGGTVNGNK
jgi:hypothetical protein